jgi:ppGpp synthetase/RelA/SpoT-type nucleotidyltranferase
MLCGSVSSKKIIESGYFMSAHMLIPQFEQRHLEKEKVRVEKQVRTMQTRLVNIGRRLAELEEEIKASDNRGQT